jgi:hypothetical protein
MRSEWRHPLSPVTRCKNAYLPENKGRALAPVTSEAVGSSPIVPPILLRWASNVIHSWPPSALLRSRVLRALTAII